MITILGENMSQFRPTRPRNHLKGEWKITYSKKPKLVVKGKVVKLLIRTKDGRHYSIKAPDHIEAINALGLNALIVRKLGYLLEDGTEVWK